MCNIIVINKGEKKIETPREFKEHFGFLPEGIPEDKIHMDCCLCGFDIDETFKHRKIRFKYDPVPDIYYVGMLEKVIIPETYNRRS